MSVRTDAPSRIAPPSLLRRLEAVSGLVIGLAAIVATEVARPGFLTPEGPSEWAVTAGFLSFAGAGGLILWLRPGHAVGRLLAFAGSLPFVATWIEAVGARHPAPGWQVLTITENLLWPCIMASIFGAFLVFPDGRLPSRRWRIVVGGMGVSIVGVALSETLRDLEALGAAQPPLLLLRTADLVAASFPIALVSALVALVVRLRRASAVERRQFAALLIGLGLTFLAIVLNETHVLDDRLGAAGPQLFGAMVAMTPAALVVAVLRYRLYDIGQVVRRTATYAIVTAVAVAVYAGLVLGVQAAFGGRGNSDLVVAGSTLAAAAVFRPLVTTVQDRIDRRFNRARFDAEATLAVFTGQLRSEVQLDGVRRALVDAVRRTVEPSAIGVWLVDGPSRPQEGS